MSKISFYQWGNIIHGVIMTTNHKYPTKIAALNALKNLSEEELKMKFNPNQNACLIGLDKKLSYQEPSKCVVHVAFYYSSYGEVLLSKEIGLVDYLTTTDKDEWSFNSKITADGFVMCRFDWLTAINEVPIPKELSGYTPDVLLLRHIDGNENNNMPSNLQWYMPEMNPELVEEAIRIRNYRG